MGLRQHVLRLVVIASLLTLGFAAGFAAPAAAQDIGARDPVCYQSSGGSLIWHIESSGVRDTSGSVAVRAPPATIQRAVGECVTPL